MDLFNHLVALEIAEAADLMALLSFGHSSVNNEIINRTLLKDVIVFVKSAKRIYCSLNHNTLRHTLSLAGERDVGCKALRRYVTLRHSHACQNNMSNVHAFATTYTSYTKLHYN